MSTRLNHHPHSAVGTILFDGNWYLLMIAAETFDGIRQRVQGAPAIRWTSRPHISVIKGEAPSRNVTEWGKTFNGAEIGFSYSDVIHHENGVHAWIDCYSTELCRMREHFGAVTLRRSRDDVFLVNFHLTLGKLVSPVERNLREQYRLSAASHIDVETGMQHL